MRYYAGRENMAASGGQESFFVGKIKSPNSQVLFLVNVPHYPRKIFYLTTWIGQVIINYLKLYFF